MVISFLCSVGGMFISYCIGRFLNNLSLFLEDSGRDNILCKASSYTSVLFYYLGIPVCVAVRLLQSYPNKCFEESIRKEEREKANELEKAAVRSAVSSEHDRLVSFYLEEMRKQRDKIRAEESEKHRERLREILDKGKAEE